MSETALDILLNVVIPVVIVAVIVAVVMYFTSKSSKEKPHYDEMQLVIRGKGYRIGFMVMLIGLFAGGALLEFSGRFSSVVAPSIVMWAVACVGLAAFFLYCIARDAFYSIGENRKAYMGLCVAVTLCNGIPAVRRIIDGRLIEDGRITFWGCSDLLLAVLFATLLVALIIKEISSRREVGE